MNEPLNHETLNYLNGFGNQFASEAVAGALPQGRNNPQKVAHGLYAELLSGTAFTAPRADNHRTWTHTAERDARGFRTIGACRPEDRREGRCRGATRPDALAAGGHTRRACGLH